MTDTLLDLVNRAFSSLYLYTRTTHCELIQKERTNIFKRNRQEQPLRGTLNSIHPTQPFLFHFIPLHAYHATSACLTRPFLLSALTASKCCASLLTNFLCCQTKPPPFFPCLLMHLRYRLPLLYCKFSLLFCVVILQFDYYLFIFGSFKRGNSFISSMARIQFSPLKCHGLVCLLRR